MNTVPTVTRMAQGNVTSVNTPTSTMIQSRNAVSGAALLFSSFPEFLISAFFSLSSLPLSSLSQQIVVCSPSVPNKSLTYQG